MSIENATSEGRVTVRFIVFDADGKVRDIKEQELSVPAPLLRDVERVRRFAEAHADALGRVFDSPHENVERAMPADLVHLSVLELSRPQTREELTAACLTKKRLGKLLA